MPVQSSVLSPIVGVMLLIDVAAHQKTTISCFQANPCAGCGRWLVLFKGTKPLQAPGP